MQPNSKCPSLERATALVRLLSMQASSMGSPSSRMSLPPEQRRPRPNLRGLRLRKSKTKEFSDGSWTRCALLAVGSADPNHHLADAFLAVTVDTRIIKANVH